MALLSSNVLRNRLGSCITFVHRQMQYYIGQLQARLTAAAWRLGNDIELGDIDNFTLGPSDRR